MVAISKVRMLLDGVYGQRFLNRIGLPAALVSSRKLAAVHGSWAEYDKKKEEKADKALRRSVLQMNLDVLDFATDAKSDERRDRKNSGVAGGKADDS